VKPSSKTLNALISPSEFLIQRYRDCGIDHPRFYMLENDLPAHFSEERRPDYQQTYSPELNRYAFFGQLNFYKGPLVLLKAAYLLQEKGITNFTLHIHGANLEHQPKELQQEFELFHEG